MGKLGEDLSVDHRSHATKIVAVYLMRPVRRTSQETVI